MILVSVGMNDAAMELGQPIQYCMVLPNEIMNTLKLPAVTNARASEDNFPTNNDRWKIGYTSLFYGAVAIRLVLSPVSSAECCIWVTGFSDIPPSLQTFYGCDLDRGP